MYASRNKKKKKNTKHKTGAWASVEARQRGSPASDSRSERSQLAAAREIFDSVPARVRAEYVSTPEGRLFDERSGTYCSAVLASEILLGVSWGWEPEQIDIHKPGFNTYLNDPPHLLDNHGT
jgi:hypothetical protein